MWPARRMALATGSGRTLTAGAKRLWSTSASSSGLVRSEGGGPEKFFGPLELCSGDCDHPALVNGHGEASDAAHKKADADEGANRPSGAGWPASPDEACEYERDDAVEQEPCPSG